MPDATHYTCRVTWSAEDGEHVATVAEFPSLSWLAPTPGEALAGLADVVRDALADLAASGEQIPEPSPAYGIRWATRPDDRRHRQLSAGQPAFGPGHRSTDPSNLERPALQY